MKELVYISNSRLPIERAHGIQIMNMCAELDSICTQHGWKFKLIIPNRSNALGKNPFLYYQFEKTFTILRLWCIDTIAHAVWLGPLAYWIQTLTFMMSVLSYKILNHNSQRVVYSRESYIAALFGNSVWEVHAINTMPSWIFRLICKRIDIIVAITEGLRNDIVKLGYPANKVTVAPDGINLEMFSNFLDKTAARKETGLSEHASIAVYTGSFFQHEWKGVDVLLQAATLISAEENIHIVLVGGHPEEFDQLSAYQNKPHITLVGHSDREQIKKYLAAADMLILPNKSGFVTSERHTSPMKLFEYMAAARPIIASDLPSIREILDETSAIMVEPNNPTALANAIREVAKNPDTFSLHARNAAQRVSSYTWKSRAAKIFESIESILQTNH